MNFHLIRNYGCLLLKFIEKNKLPYIIGTPEGDKLATFDAVFLQSMKSGNSSWVYPLILVLCAVFGYIIGSLNFAVIISKIFYKDDVRLHGSGNAGATNMLRTYGKKAGIATFVCDALKGAVSVLVSMLLMGQGGAYIAGLFCILGHIFPVFYKFRGGKGVVVAAITVLCLEPLVFLFLVLLFVFIVYWSRFISLGSIICAFFFPLLHNAFSQNKGFLSVTVSVLIAAIVIVMHHSNIKRLMNRTENKLSFSRKEKK